MLAYHRLERQHVQTIIFDKEKISEIECVDSEGKRKEKPLNKGRVLTVPKQSTKTERSLVQQRVDYTFAP